MDLDKNDDGHIQPHEIPDHLYAELDSHNELPVHLFERHFVLDKVSF
jgi:hypothetical protein